MPHPHDPPEPKTAPKVASKQPDLKAVKAVIIAVSFPSDTDTKAIDAAFSRIRILAEREFGALGGEFIKDTTVN